jgi:hypothetical protein
MGEVIPLKRPFCITPQQNPLKSPAEILLFTGVRYMRYYEPPQPRKTVRRRLSKKSESDIRARNTEKS